MRDEFGQWSLRPLLRNPGSKILLMLDCPVERVGHSPFRPGSRAAQFPDHLLRAFAFLVSITADPFFITHLPVQKDPN